MSLETAINRLALALEKFNANQKTINVEPSAAPAPSKKKKAVVDLPEPPEVQTHVETQIELPLVFEAPVEASVKTPVAEPTLEGEIVDDEELKIQLSLEDFAKQARPMLAELIQIKTKNYVKEFIKNEFEESEGNASNIYPINRERFLKALEEKLEKYR